MGLTIERRRKRTIRLEGKAILACALPLVTDPENLGKHAKRIRLRPVLDVLDAIYDRLVPVRRGEFSGRIVQRGAQLVLTGASELVVRPGRSQLEHLLRALVGREVTLRGSVAAPVAFGQPRQLLKPSLVAPFFVRNIKGLARVQGGATTLEAARLIRPDGEPTGPPLASVDLFGSLSEILTERVDGRILELAGYFIPGSAPALLVTQIDGRVATRTRLIEPKGRVSRITRGKKVEVLYLLPDRNHVRVRTWGWYFTRGTGTLPLDLVVLGEEPPPSRTRGLTGALGRTQ
jgi:hypothetical protein